MKNSHQTKDTPRHLMVKEPSPWVCRFAPLAPKGGAVLDLACGGGRHTRLFLSLGYAVVALDRDIGPVRDLETQAQIIKADLEGENSWPLADRTFAGIVVTNYLHRPLLGRLLDAVEPNGVFIYETFARGNEKYTKPRNPDHLLRGEELLKLVQGRMQVIAYEHGIVEKGPLPGVIQRICAINDLGSSIREDGEPEPHNLF